MLVENLKLMNSFEPKWSAIVTVIKNLLLENIGIK